MPSQTPVHALSFSRGLSSQKNVKLSLELAAVAFFDIVTVVPLTAVTVVLDGMPAPAMNSPTEAFAAV